MATLYDDVKVIDADTHFTEPPDLWTSRAPAAYQDRILHIEQRNGVPTWVVDGAELGFAKGGGVVDHDGGKIPFLESMEKGIDWVHPGAWDVKARLQVMDECGIHAQVLFPNAVGLGGHMLNTVVQDATLRLLCIEIYNDAMAEMQDESNLRFLPMPVMPAWDVDLCVDTALVHDLQAGLHVPRAGVDPLDALFHRLQERDLAAVVVDHAAALCETELDAVDDPRRHSVALLDVQDPVLVGGRRATRPQVRWLREMRVGVDHLDVVIQLRHGGAPFDRSPVSHEPCWRAVPGS